MGEISKTIPKEQKEVAKLVLALRKDLEDVKQLSVELKRDVKAVQEQNSKDSKTGSPISPSTGTETSSELKNEGLINDSSHSQLSSDQTESSASIKEELLCDCPASAKIEHWADVWTIFHVRTCQMYHKEQPIRGIKYQIISGSSPKGYVRIKRLDLQNNELSMNSPSSQRHGGAEATVDSMSINDTGTLGSLTSLAPSNILVQKQEDYASDPTMNNATSDKTSRSAKPNVRKSGSRKIEVPQTKPRSLTSQGRLKGKHPTRVGSLPAASSRRQRDKP